MQHKVFINGRPAIHIKCGGVLQTHDPCFTGVHNSVIVYNNIAKACDASNTSRSVYCKQANICHSDSYFSQSYGDELGTGGGIRSCTIKGRAEFLSYSEDVFIEGKAAVRAGDLMQSNNGNTSVAPLIIN